MNFYWFKLMVLVLSFILFGCPRPLPPYISDGIQKIAEARSKCEQWGSIVKKDFSRDSKEHQKTNALYINAKAAFDGWIDRLKFDLTADADITNSDTYKKALEEASEKSNAFVKYVTELHQSTKTKSFIAEVLPSLSDAGIKVWQEYRKAKEEQRKEIKKELDNLKWKEFDELK